MFRGLPPWRPRPLSTGRVTAVRAPLRTVTSVIGATATARGTGQAGAGRAGLQGSWRPGRAHVDERQRGHLSEPLLGQGRSVPFRSGREGAETGANDRRLRLNGGDCYLAVSGTHEVDRSRHAYADSEAASLASARVGI